MIAEYIQLAGNAMIPRPRGLAENGGKEVRDE
jgi:hypothetical protein